MRSLTEKLENSLWLPWLMALAIMALSFRLLGLQFFEPRSQPSPAPPVLTHPKIRPAIAPEPVSHGVNIAMNSVDPELERDSPELARMPPDGHVPNQMSLGKIQNLHSYTYLFEGKVLMHDQPVPKASILVRITTGNRTYVQGAIADDAGDYSITIPIQANADEPVDYTMDAHDPEFHQVELVGRRISAHESETVMVAKPMNIVEAASPAKP